VSALGFDAPEASRILLDEASIAATAMVGWGGPVAEKYVRFVYSAEPVERLQTIPERLSATRLGSAVSALH
jgi:aspartate/methionine/tyrosine aminotransferase